MVREHPQELARQFDWASASRAEFHRLCAVDPDTLTDIQRAARFAYLQTNTFGGKPATDATPGQTGMITPHHRAHLRSMRMRRLIEAAHRRLQGVHVDCLDWAVFVRRYDREFVLFYIDPPYRGHENDYGKGLFDGRFWAHGGDAGQAEGRFILSLNDTPETREMFRGFGSKPWKPDTPPTQRPRGGPESC